MQDNTKSLISGYAIAIASTVVATCLNLWSRPYLGEHVPYITFFPAVFVTAIFAGFRPTLLTVGLCGLAAAYWFVPPSDSLIPENGTAWAGMTLFIVFGVAIGLLSQLMHRKSTQVARERERFSVTLASIGDGVIVTDENAQITFMNGVAEQLTGWSFEDAQNRSLVEMFHVVNEQTRQTTENPIAIALREKRVVGLANHTLLIAKDGTERAINDSAAPIREANGKIIGAVLVFRDVSKQRASQITSGRLAALVDSSEDAIIGQTFDGVVTDWNGGAERLFGFASGETIGRSIFESIVPPDRREEHITVLRRVQRGEPVAQFETLRRCRDEREIPVAVRISPILGADGEVIGASTIDRDISQQIAAEQRRNARVAVTQILAHDQSVDQAIAEILVAVGSALDWDSGCFWKFDPDEAVLRCQEFWQGPSRDLDDFRISTMRQTFAAKSKGAASESENAESEWIHEILVDLEYFRASQAKNFGFDRGFACTVAVGDDFLGIAEWFSQDFHEPDDDLLEMMATIGGQIGQFIERKNSEKALKESERLYRAIGESIDYGVWVCDSTGRNIYTSESFLKLVGLTQAECSEFGWGQILPPDEAEETQAAWKKCVRENETWYREHSVLGVDGNYHPILARGVPVKNDQGQVVRWVGINLDIGRIREVEDALRDADRRKDEFLAMLAHELRNPLAPIRSGLDILMMDAVDHQETIQLMQEQVEQVVRLVDDLLDVSRITRGKIELRRESVELGALVGRSVNAVRSLIENHEQELITHLPKKPVWLKADPVRIVQVIGNLLNNASKYTDVGGQIELTVACQDDEVLIDIRDNGVGIEPELLPHVFELFTQSTRSLDRSQGGLGIGLTLVQRIIEMHGGTVSVHSEGPGHGSTFSLRLPLIEAEAPTDAQTEESDSIQSHRILVVDDNIAATRLLTLLLGKLGTHEIEAAHDGPSALEKVRSMHPDLVLLDIGLPGMDGYQVARTIRKDNDFNDVRLVALTGYGQEEDRQMAAEAGFNEHLVKPPSVDQLRELLTNGIQSESFR